MINFLRSNYIAKIFLNPSIDKLIEVFHICSWISLSVENCVEADGRVAW